MSIVDHIAFRVYDLEKAKRWYEKNLDAKMTHRDEFYIRMSLENTTIALIDANRYPYDHIGILVDDANDLPKVGQRVEHRDGTIGVYIRDPFGNVIEYIWYSGDAKDKINGKTKTN
tara:strand:- start:1964 stop:2311 length:348 start_codon:yes stop_codon:yes gene_type:complete